MKLITRIRVMVFWAYITVMVLVISTVMQAFCTTIRNRCRTIQHQEEFSYNDVYPWENDNADMSPLYSLDDDSPLSSDKWARSHQSVSIPCGSMGSCDVSLLCGQTYRWSSKDPLNVNVVDNFLHCVAQSSNHHVDNQENHQDREN